MGLLHPLQPFGHRGEARSAVTCPTEVPNTSSQLWQLVLDADFSCICVSCEPCVPSKSRSQETESRGKLPAGHLHCLLFAFFLDAPSCPCLENSFQGENTSTSLPCITHWWLWKEARKAFKSKALFPHISQGPGSFCLIPQCSCIAGMQQPP